ncbi:MAG: adenosylcobinamide-GDP ribazoletransferase [Thermoguttaceae bacterium]
MRRLLAAMRFLTILPLPGARGTSEADLAGSPPFFPLVGLLLGAVAAAVAWALCLAVPPLLASALIVILLVGLSGGLHMDGLSDTADGFFSSRPRGRALEIMKQSQVGAMGVIAIVAAFLVKFAALASLPAAAMWRAVFLAPLAGRSALLVQMAVLAYVRPSGLAAVFGQARPRLAAVFAAAVLALAGWAVAGGCGLTAAGLSLLSTLGFARYCYWRIGGATGDTYGAGCEIAEIVPPLCFAVWPLSIKGPWSAAG